MSNATIINIQHAPPSVNNLYFNVPGKGRVKSNRYKIWRSAASWDIKAAKPSSFSCKVILDLTVEKPKGVRSDISNRIKAIEDVLVEMGVLVDDSQIEEVRARWGAVKGARIELREFDMIVPIEPSKPRREDTKRARG